MCQLCPPIGPDRSEVTSEVVNRPLPGGPPGMTLKGVFFLAEKPQYSPQFGRFQRPILTPQK